MAYANIATIPTNFVTPLMKGQARNVWRKSQTRTRHFSLFFCFCCCSTFPYLPSKAPRSLSEFFFRYLFDQILLCRFKLVRRTSTLYWMAFHIDTKNPPAWYKHLFTLSRRVAQQPSIRYGNDPVSWSVRRSFVMFNIETATKSPFFCCVNRSAMRYGFRAGVRAIWYRVDKA